MFKRLREKKMWGQTASFDSSCAHGVGVDSPDKIPDEAITTNEVRVECQPSGANITQNITFGASGARLGNMGKAWFAATDSSADYIQYDMGEVRIIAAMQAQGANHNGCYAAPREYTSANLGPSYRKNCHNKTCICAHRHKCVKNVVRKFKVLYSRDGRSWIPLATRVGDVAWEFRGPLRRHAHTDTLKLDFKKKDLQSKPDNAPEQYEFPSKSNPGIGPFEARYIRIYVVQGGVYGRSSIQMEFYGPRCQAAGAVPVGIASYAVPDNAMTRNETYGGNRLSAASLARLNTKGAFVANWKGYGSGGFTPPGFGFRGNLWVQVDVGKVVRIAAVATQGDPVLNQWTTQYKLGASADGETFSMTTGILQGNHDTASVAKNYVTPFSARYVRLYAWDGATQAVLGGPRKIWGVRMELYAVATSFQWANGAPLLRDHSPHGEIGSDAFCNATMADLAPSFLGWTEGMHGDGNIYESEPVRARLSDGVYTLTAYQRCTSKFLGTMSKLLVCFKSEDEGDQRCCVNKEADSLERGVWDQQESEIKMS